MTTWFLTELKVANSECMAACSLASPVAVLVWPLLPPLTVYAVSHQAGGRSSCCPMAAESLKPAGPHY